MPLSKLFAERLHYFEELPFEEAYLKFDAPISEYQSPELLFKSLTIPTPETDVPVMVYRPADISGKLPVVIWIHGGGFRIGSYLMNEGDIASRELSHKGNFVVVNVDYRLVTDEIKFPAPQNDCMAVLDWVVANSEKLGVRRDAIFVGGVSAGGCLAATMAVLDRDNGHRYIAGQLLNCPVLHKALPALSAELEQKLLEMKGFGFSADMVAAVNVNAVKDGALEAANPVWWAGEVQNLRGLPPAQIYNCEYDALRASGEAYGAALAEAGVEVEVVMQTGVPHAHLNRVPADCPEYAETISGMIDFVNKVTKS